MKEELSFQLITRCFSAGANPREEAEIRVPAIRGQLRWWFRVLGGTAEQENDIFGSAAGDNGTASKLIIRILPSDRKLPSSTVKFGKAEVQSSSTPYLLWPMAQKIKDAHGIEHENSRCCLAAGTLFRIRFDWRGAPAIWDNVRALISVFGNLGAIGYRGRRAQGALCFPDGSPILLSKALARFPNHSKRMEVRELATAKDASDASRQLAGWLKKWREHGQQSGRWMRIDENNKSKGHFWKPISTPGALTQPGFPFARRDHNEGLKQLTGSYPVSDPIPPAPSDGTTFRAALGLPIVQYFSSLGDATNGPRSRFLSTVNWSRIADGEGRFASPVILRPHFDGVNWRALILFINCHAWKAGDPVYLNGKARSVSLTLYNEMKRDVPLCYP